MFWNRTNEKISEQWKIDSAHGLEAGEMPIFDLGMSNTSLDGVFGLMALQEMIKNRKDIVQPLVAIGGNSALWLFAMLQTSRGNSITPAAESKAYRNRSYSQIKEPIVVFSGMDPATHIALLSTHVPTEDSAATVSPKKRWIGVNNGMRHLFAPESEPTAMTQAESLPFIIRPVQMHHKFTHYSQTSVTTPQSISPAPKQTLASREQTHEQTQWIARAVIGLAVLMLLAAIVA